MEYSGLGRTKLTVSRLCLGSMQFGWTADEAASQKVLSEAFSAGINFIDTADIYSRWANGNPGGVAEQIIGRWMATNSIPRDKLILASKVRGNMGGGPEDEGLSRQHIQKAVEASLRRLQTDYLDLYQAHWPDEKTPIEETLRAFDELVKQGKVRHIGASNYAAWQLMQSLWVSDLKGLVRYDSLQPHYNLVHRDEFERELESVSREYQLGVIPYSPLAGGFLTGKYRRNLTPNSMRVNGAKKYFNDKNWGLLERMESMAKEKGCSISQLALAWLLANPVITSPIIGPNSLPQLKENLGAVGIKFSTEEKSILDDTSAWREGRD